MESCRKTSGVEDKLTASIPRYFNHNSCALIPVYSIYTFPLSLKVTGRHFSVQTLLNPRALVQQSSYDFLFPEAKRPLTWKIIPLQRLPTTLLYTPLYTHLHFYSGHYTCCTLLYLSKLYKQRFLTEHWTTQNTGSSNKMQCILIDYNSTV